MKSLLILFFIIFPIRLTFSMGTNPHVIYKAGKDLPLEFNYILDSLQQYIKTKEDKNLFKLKVSKLDQLFSKMTKEEIFFIVKSESYKTILKIKPDFTIKESYYDRKSLKVFTKLFNSKTISSFSMWVAKSIYNDINNIFSSSEFTTYMFRRKNNAILTKEYVLIDKKLSILLPWIGYLSLSRPNEFEEDMKRYMNQLFEKIMIYSNQYLEFSKFEKVELSPVITKLKFFTLSEKEDSKSMKTNSKGTSLRIEDVNIDPDQFLVDEDEDENSGPDQFLVDDDAVSGWMPKATAPLIPTPDPNYKRPKSLPVPINDWMDSL